jgi:hypothetical protein
MSADTQSRCDAYQLHSGFAVCWAYLDAPEKDTFNPVMCKAFGPTTGLVRRVWITQNLADFPL